MDIYFDKSYKTICYDYDSHLLLGIWNMTSLSHEYREGMEKMLEAIKHYKCGRLLYDTSKTSVLPQDDLQWTGEHWYPRAMAAGMRRMAIVLSEDTFVRMAIDDLRSRSSELDTAYFSSIAMAKDWIIEKG